MKIRFKVNLGLYKMSAEQLFGFATSVRDKVNANTFFAVPHPELAALSDAIDAIAAAISNAQGGGIVQTTILREKRIALINLLTEMGHYVEDVANDPANLTPIELPVEIIESAGMKVKGFTPRQKGIFTVTAGRLFGTVIVTAESVSRGFHEWQFTTTPDDDSSWVNASSTTRARIELTGLVSGSRVYVRHRAVLISGPENWTSPISVIVP